MDGYGNYESPKIASCRRRPSVPSGWRPSGGTRRIFRECSEDRQRWGSGGLRGVGGLRDAGPGDMCGPHELADEHPNRPIPAGNLAANSCHATITRYAPCMAMLVEAIRRAILASDKTRYRIAQESGVTAGQLSRLVHGERGLSAESLERLADCLGLEIVVRPRRARKGK